MTREHLEYKQICLIIFLLLYSFCCRNAIQMFNGEFFDPRQMIGQITANSTLRERKLRYSTGMHYDTLGLRVTGSAAFGDFGFIAEIVTLPMSPSGRPDFGMFHLPL
jgi:hypothetical protein